MKLSRYLETNQRMREEDPADPMPWYNEGLHLLNDGRDDEAIAFLERAMVLGQRFLSPRCSRSADRVFSLASFGCTLRGVR
ncbi:hypothetical protein WME76_12545 [Sorangium sp. So ce119]|uniref:tetratricopeptide repeat protein n=1 Tax=Sorangium sp. So ce119 TaxID=3133279 RepID=UPI003F5DA479